MRPSLPLQPEERKLLTVCEDTIRDRLVDFVSVGEALKTITAGKLHRETHRTFADYCKERWGLKRRTAHQKIQVAEVFANVRNCAPFPPSNEFQVRQLLALSTPELQQTAWQRVVANHENAMMPLTAGEVREAVRELLLEHSDNPLAALLTVDRTFPGITHRWDICTPCPDFSPGEPRFDLAPLPVPDDLAVGHADAPLVLVSPDVNLSSGDIPHTYLCQLYTVLGSARQRRFLLHMDEPYRYKFKDWPPNMEMVVQVRRQADINTLEDDFSLHCIWFVPEERLSIPATISIGRVLIGAPGWAEGRSRDEVISLRRLVAETLTRPVAVHIASGLNSLFCS